MSELEAEEGLPIEWYQSELRACRAQIEGLAALLVEGRELLEAHATRIAELEEARQCEVCGSWVDP